MLYFNADARDGGMGMDMACDTCCCQPVSLRPGETNLVMINYAPWVLPIAPPGLISGGTEYAVDHDTQGCATNAIEGFVPPTNSNYTLSTPAGMPLTVDLSPNAEPAGNTFTYALVMLQGVQHGTLQQVTPGGPTFTYTPNAGWTGYDYFTYVMTDAQGRDVTRTVRISVGQHHAVADVARMSLVPFVDISKAKINPHLHTLQFAVTMPVSCRPCDTYRLTIKQAARDCERNVYHHLMCFDLRCRDCG